MSFSIRYTGIDELIHALRGVDDHLLFEAQTGLMEVGDVVRDDARHRFTARFGERSSEKSALSVQRTAQGFQTQARGITSGATVRVGVGQKLRKVTGKRPDWGGEMMTVGLLPARDTHEREAADILEARVFGLFKANGF